jgi:hypothetical protein
MGPGSAFTVTVAVAVQPLGPVVIIAAVPAELPPINPGLSTDAIDGLPDVHTTPGVALDSVVVNPTHNPRLPVIGAGLAFTLIIAVV